MNKNETFIEPRLKGVSYRWQKSTSIKNKRIVALSNKSIEYLQSKSNLVIMDSIGLFLACLRRLNKHYGVIHLIDYDSREKVDDFIVEKGIRDEFYKIINGMDVHSYNKYVSIKDKVTSLCEDDLKQLGSFESFIDYIEKEYE